MLEADNYARWERGRLRGRRSFRTGAGHTILRLDEDTYQRARDAQQRQPFLLGRRHDAQWWWYRGRYYRDRRDLLSDDVKALVDETAEQPADRRRT